MPPIALSTAFQTRVHEGNWMKRLVATSRGDIMLHTLCGRRRRKESRPAMDYIGIDLHKNSSQVCILTEDGELIERRIKTDRESFDKLFSERPSARILVEASTESEWAARHFEALGHEVIVADPNFAPMYATRDRRIKTDKRDARALCEACRFGAYRPAHRTSDRQRDVRAHLSVRERTRSKYISLIVALARARGLPHRGWPIAELRPPRGRGGAARAHLGAD